MAAVYSGSESCGPRPARLIRSFNPSVAVNSRNFSQPCPSPIRRYAIPWSFLKCSITFVRLEEIRGTFYLYLDWSQRRQYPVESQHGILLPMILNTRQIRPGKLPEIDFNFVIPWQAVGADQSRERILSCRHITFAQDWEGNSVIVRVAIVKCYYHVVAVEVRWPEA